MKKYDAILYIEKPINEATVDPRLYSKDTPKTTKGFSKYWNADDPKMYSSFTFGNALRQSLSNIGPGYICKVTDFKKWVVVDVGYHNNITGRTAEKTFLIVFQEKGDGIILSTHNRYRSISGVDQAASYIKSACNSLQGYSQNRVG